MYKRVSKPGIRVEGSGYSQQFTSLPPVLDWGGGENIDGLLPATIALQLVSCGLWAVENRPVSTPADVRVFLTEAAADAYIDALPAASQATAVKRSHTVSLPVNVDP